MKREDIQIKPGLAGFQDETVDHKCGACGREVSLIVVAQHAKLKIRWFACPRLQARFRINRGQDLSQKAFRRRRQRTARNDPTRIS